jgi:uncharacterized pyridoxal phosphate-containing UPF0001 family protein
LADDVAARLVAIRRAVAEAGARAGRDPAAIRIVAVTKGFPSTAVVAALAAGLMDIGENYVQEAAAKRRTVPAGRWHLIGGLQRNKVRAALAVFDCVETVDRPDLARALAAEAASAERRLPVLVQVNAAGEMQKRGVAPDGVERLAEAVIRHPSLALEGS